MLNECGIVWLCVIVQTKAKMCGSAFWVFRTPFYVRSMIFWCCLTSSEVSGSLMHIRTYFIRAYASLKIITKPAELASSLILWWTKQSIIHKHSHGERIKCDLHIKIRIKKLSLTLWKHKNGASTSSLRFQNVWRFWSTESELLVFELLELQIMFLYAQLYANHPAEFTLCGTSKSNDGRSFYD